MRDDLSRMQSFDDVTARIWRDKRCTPGTRELLLALAWIMDRDPNCNDPDTPKAERGKYLWRQLGIMLGVERGRPRYKQLVADDAPCYQPPNTWPNRACEAPRIRAYRPRTSDAAPIVSVTCLIRHPHLGECRHSVVPGAVAPAVKPAVAEASTLCGATPKPDFRLVERDPLTGWHIEHWFCTRHRDHFERVKAQLADAPPAPEPIPNTGGLLPCYFKADWERVYTQVRPHWKAPVYGLAADDWPGVISGGMTPRRPRLRLIVGELADA